MSLLWAVPPVAVAGALVMALVQLRRIAEATADLHLELRRLSDARPVMAEVRSATAEARALARGIRRA